MQEFAAEFSHTVMHGEQVQKVLGGAGAAARPLPQRPPSAGGAG